MNTESRNQESYIKKKISSLFGTNLKQDPIINTDSSVSPTTSILCITLVLLLIIFVLRLLYNQGQLFSYNGLNQSQASVVNDVLLAVSILFAVFFILLTFFSGLKEIGKLLSNISSSFLIIGYTFFLLYCFYTIPISTFNTYASTLVPFFLFLTSFVFGSSLITSFFGSRDGNGKKPLYDRINTMILFFCFIVTSILFYTVNPGNYITDHFGSLSLLTLLLGIFVFVYLILLFIIPNQFSPFTQIAFSWNWQWILTIISFLLFTVLIGVGIAYYPGGFFSPENVWPSLTITVLLSLVLSVLSIFAITKWSSIDSSSINSEKMGIFKRSLTTVFALVISGLLITWLTLSIESATGTTGIISFLLNGALIMVILAFIYRSLNPHFSKDTRESKRENVGSLFTKLFFYLPCFFSEGVDTFSKFVADPESYDKVSSILLIVFTIVLLYGISHLKKTVSSSSLIQGNLVKGTTLINSNPISLNQQTNLSTYEELNNLANTTLPIQHNYQYAISLSFFLESNPSNSAYHQYQSILNYGNKPEVLYRHADNSLLITMEKNGLREIPLEPTNENKGTIDFSNNQIIMENPDEYDSKGIYQNSRILYKQEKIRLQRWNHLVLNYVNGTMDIFYNGKLVKTVAEVVPYLTLDSLTVGAENGVQGQIKQVVYYPMALTLKEINRIT